MKSDGFFDGALSDGLGDGPVECLDEPCVAGEADLGGSFVDAVYEVVGDAEQHLLLNHDGMLSPLIADTESDSVSDMTTGKVMRNSIYVRSQQDALTKISVATTRAAKVGLPEIVWNIGLTGAFGTCPDLDVLRQYARRLGDLELVTHKRHWTVDLGTGVHLRHECNPDVCGGCTS